ncbi:MAG: hypothetical protein DRO36_05135 [Candidatus Hecatellales archaeon]|nr:MAG: hypothetical protein DRO36_05135 [Candidatus Hecatellales archaeon]
MKSLTRITLVLGLVLLFLLNITVTGSFWTQSYGEKTTKNSLSKPAAGDIEVEVQKLSHTIVFPLEQSYKFTIPIKNIGKERVRLHSRISQIPENWICIGGGDLILNPNEEGKIVYAFTVFPGVKTTNSTLTVTIENLVKPDSPPATVTLEVGFKELKLTPDAEIRGKIVDRMSGEPIPNAEVKVYYWSNLDCAFAVSRWDGNFRVEVPSSETLQKIYEEYGLRGEPVLHLEVSAEGYEHYSIYNVKVPKEGLDLEVKLNPLRVQASYKLVWVKPVEGYGIWKCIPSKNWSLIAVCQGEHGFPGITTPPQTTNIYLFNGNGKLLWKKKIEQESWALDITEDGSKIVSGSHAGKVYVWDQQGNLLWMVDAGPDPVREVRFSHNGKYVAFGPTPQGRGYVGLYDSETGKLLWSYETGDHVRRIEFSHDDKYLAVSSTDGYTYLFTIDGKLLWKRYHGGYLPFILKLSSKNDMLVVAGKGQELYAYDFKGNLLWRLEAPEVIQYGDASSDLSRIVIFSNSALYMLNREGEILWWKKIPPIGHNAIAITPNGKYMVIGTMKALYLLNENGTIIWSFEDFEKGAKYSFKHNHPFLCAAQNVQITPNATKILAGFGETDRKLRLFQGGIYTLETEKVEEGDESLYRFGIGAKADAETEAKLAVKIGVSWIRPHPGPFVWGKIEPVKGQYDFSEADKVVRAAQKYGVRILATIWPYAEWDQKYWEGRSGWKPSKGFEGFLPLSRYKPHDMEAYKAFVKALVERYDGDGINDMPNLQYPIKYWEVLNEPETGMYFDENFFRGTGQDYVEILKATYEAIREADPEAKVLIAAPVHPDALNDPFWSEVLPYVKDYFNYGNVHFNVKGKGDLSLGFRKYKKALLSYGIDKKIWGTEVLPAPEYLPVEEQAELWVKGSVKAFAEGAAAIKYPYVFKDGKLLQAFKTMISILKGFKSVEKVDEGCYKFRVKNSDVYVLWSPGKLPSKVLGEVYVVDMYGNIEKKDASTIQVSDEPIYITKNEKNIVSLQTEKIQALKKPPMVKGLTPKKFKSADLNGDGKVDLEDLKALRKAYGLLLGKPNFKPEADLNNDGTIDIVDLAILAYQYGMVKGKFPVKEVGKPKPKLKEKIKPSKFKTEKIQTIVGSCVIEKPGFYVLASNIEDSETCITVKADDVTIDGKGFTLKGNLEKGKKEETFGIHAENVKNLTIKNLKLVGWTAGICLENVKNLWIENVTVRESRVDGISISFFSNVTVKNCVLEENGMSGLMATGKMECPKSTFMEAPEECPPPKEYSKDLTVIGCRASNNSVDGIFTLAVKNLTIRDCIANHNDGGIYPFFSTDGVIENCTTNHNGHVGICLCRCENIKISSCVSEENCASIRIESKNLTIENCILKNNKLDGIFLKSSNDNTIQNNIVENNEYGIRMVKDSNGNLVKENTVKNNKIYDLYMEKGLKNTFKNNKYLTSNFKP